MTGPKGSGRDRVSHTYLKSANGGTLESKVGLEVLSDLTDETLEGKLPYQKLS